MKMFCPFCKVGVEFDKVLEGEVEPCPTCQHPIQLKHLSCWGELKYDFNQLMVPIRKFSLVTIEALFAFVSGMICLLGSKTFWKMTGFGLGTALVIFLTVITDGAFLGFIVLIAVIWVVCVCALHIAKEFNPPRIPPYFYAPYTPANSVAVIQGNNNTNCGNISYTTYNHFSEPKPQPAKVHKCSYCGSKRLESVPNCQGCGAAA